MRFSSFAFSIATHTDFLVSFVLFVMASAEDSETISTQESAHSTQGDGIPFEFIVGARTDGRLLYTLEHKQLYRKKSKIEKKDGTAIGYRYLCRVSGCTARVILDIREENCKFGANNREHTHSDNQQNLYDELKVVSKIKSECEDLSTMDAGSAQISAIFQRNVRE